MYCNFPREDILVTMEDCVGTVEKADKIDFLSYSMKCGIKILWEGIYCNQVGLKW